MSLKIITAIKMEDFTFLVDYNCGENESLAGVTSDFRISFSELADFTRPKAGRPQICG